MRDPFFIVEAARARLSVELSYVRGLVMSDAQQHVGAVHAACAPLDTHFRREQAPSPSPGRCARPVRWTATVLSVDVAGAFDNISRWPAGPAAHAGLPPRPSSDMTARSSQPGPGSSAAITALPTRDKFASQDDTFRCILLRCLRLPLLPPRHATQSRGPRAADHRPEAGVGGLTAATNFKSDCR